MKRITLAIDGPAGAGKSTVAKLIAARLNLTLLDTGAMYRCVALAATRKGLDASSDPQALSEVAAAIEIRFEAGDPQRVFLNGEDVTTDIRSLEMGQAASAISVHSPVRKVMVALQQTIIAEGGFVLEGRDVTTVVAPNAELKIFLTASIEERARRRWVEIVARGESDTLPMVVKDVVERDHRDYTRPDSPLMLAEDAVIVESFGITPAEVAERIIEMALARGA